MHNGIFFYLPISLYITVENSDTILAPKRQTALLFLRRYFSAHDTAGSTYPVSYTHLDVYKRQGGECVGQIKKEFTFFKPVFTLDCSGWSIEGDLWEWNYLVSDADGRTVMTVQKELLNWTDTYVLDIADSADALYCLMVVLAIDAAKCSQNG